ncbi:MAG TPA: sn-glycerol-3-phosphate ABC transporter ATP-binding protein UgpC [Anaeromyxobacteraceae bacterium]|nr:sn-glycerol-3-phosphate ABC transporter ATP-binding protein UgpC [Anaeromyxobacteraceae bacterium]
MAGVTFKGVEKRFGETAVIKNLDLEVRDREFMVLVGPSGCGKSTALRMIAGLEDISEGTIQVGDRVVNEVPPKDRDIAMVFQNYALYPHMSIRQNLEFGLKMRKTPRTEMDRLVNEAADVLGIAPLLDRKPKQLSGGQRQRVAVGRAIVRKPAVFLFDEPLSNLDAKLRIQMRAEIMKLQRRLETTTIYVTHDQVEAMTMGHRIAVLRDGLLQQVGTPLEVYEHPANAFVAQFIGTPPMNFVRGVLRNGGTLIEGQAFSFPVPAGMRAAVAGREGLRVIAGVRPENVIAPGREARGETAPVEAVVEIVETLGDEVIVHARAGEDTLVYREDPHRAPAIGAKLSARLELANLHLFDAESEQRLS